MGKYRVSHCIGRGGMAEVFLALQEGLGGFEKLVVIKRLYPHLCHDQQFVDMFFDEARLAASLQHPNIVQILDIDNDETGFFIVMEYLAGATLSAMIRELASWERTIPASIVCRVGAGVASGLHYAHSASGDGRPGGVVHRDVTPSNIIVGFNGTVKVVDFGVAKAVKREATTDKGVLKGKTPYLTPEQIKGESVDHRADVFQLGIVLHEMLTGKPLFQADNPHLVLKQITDGEIPAPSALNPTVPAIVDDIVLSALERDPAARTQSADELSQRLESAITEMGENVSNRQVQEWMTANFAETLADRKRIERTALNERAPPTDPQFDTRKPAPGHGTPTAATAIERPVPKPGSGARDAWPWALLAIFVAVGAAWLARSGGDVDEGDSVPHSTPAALAPTSDAAPAGPGPAETIDTDEPGAMARDAAPTASTFSISVSTVPTGATVELDGNVVGTGAYGAIIPAGSHQLRVFAAGYLPRQFTVDAAHPPPEVIRLEALDAPARTPKEETRNKLRKRPSQPETQPFGSDNLNPWKAE